MVRLRLRDIMIHPLRDVLDLCNVLKINPIANSKGEIIKIIVEYAPQKSEGVNTNIK